MIIDDVKDQIITLVSGAFGENVFIGDLPVDKQNSLAIILTPSPIPNLSIPYYEQMIDIWVRDSQYTECIRKLELVKNYFHQKQNYELGDSYVYLSNLIGGIVDNDRDIEENKVCSMTLRFVYRSLDLVS